MKTKLILKSELQSKYYLGLQSLSPGYPTPDDFVFECANFSIAKNKKTLGQEGITFSKSSLKDVFGERLQNPAFLRALKDLIQNMLGDGRLTKPDEEHLTIPIETLSNLFSIA